MMNTIPPISPQIPPPIPPPASLVTNCQKNYSRMRQYGPCWIYNTSLLFMGIGQFGLHRWDITLLSAASGFVAMQIFCCCVGPPPSTPAASNLIDQVNRNVNAIGEARGDLGALGNEAGDGLRALEDVEAQTDLNLILAQEIQEQIRRIASDGNV